LKLEACHDNACCWMPRSRLGLVARRLRLGARQLVASRLLLEACVVLCSTWGVASSES